MKPAAPTLLLGLALWLVGGPLTSPASGDGLPVIGLDTSRIGIENPSDGTRYYAMPDRGGTRLLKATREPDAAGQSIDSTELRGVLAVPGVAFDGTTSGLSADGAKLALIEPRRSFPRARTRLMVISTRRLAPKATIDLRGDFSFDAISPDGTRIYLIHYLSPRDPTRYEVRAYDLTAKRLLAEPIIDKRVAPRVMRGFPLTRASSPDGVWAYTLYDGGSGRDAIPFVHALDTAEGRALCVDLEILLPWSKDLSDLSLQPSPDGSTVDVLAPDGVPIASIETNTWTVDAPSAVGDSTASSGSGGSSGGSGRALIALGLGAAALGGAVLTAGRRRRSRRTPRRRLGPYPGSRGTRTREPAPPADPFTASPEEPEVVEPAART